MEDRNTIKAAVIVGAIIGAVMAYKRPKKVVLVERRRPI